MKFGLHYDSPIFYDLETSGLDPAIHEIIQIGAYHPVSGDSFSCNVKFDIKKASPEALEINRYCEAWVKNALSQQQAAEQFNSFCKAHVSMARMSKAGKPYRTAVLMGYNNSHFDKAFIDKMIFNFGMFANYDMRQLDVLELAKWLLPYEVKYDLSSMVKYFGMEPVNAHNALADVYMTADVAACLIEILAESETYKMPRWAIDILDKQDDGIPF